MCGRFTLTTKDFGKVASELGAELEESLASAWKPRYNIAPTDAHPVLVEDAGKRKLQPATWGFRRKGIPTLWINAKSETAAKNGLFKRAFADRRCAVPADGFLEWQGTARQRRPMWFHAPDGGLLLFAGLWDERDGQRSFTVLTTAANELVAPVHDRMPVLLPRSRVDAWLRHPDAALLVPAEAGLLIATPVSPRVNSVKFDDPECLAPPPPEPADRRRQLKLL